MLAPEQEGAQELKVRVLLLGEPMAFVFRHQVPKRSAISADGLNHLFRLGDRHVRIVLLSKNLLLTLHEEPTEKLGLELHFIENNQTCQPFEGGLGFGEARLGVRIPKVEGMRGLIGGKLTCEGGLSDLPRPKNGDDGKLLKPILDRGEVRDVLDEHGVTVVEFIEN